MDAASPSEAFAEDDILSEILGESVTPAGPPEPVPGGRTEAPDSGDESAPSRRTKGPNPGSDPAQSGQTETPESGSVGTKGTKTKSADEPDFGARATIRQPPGVNEDGIDGKHGRGSPAETYPARPTANGPGHAQTKSPSSARIEEISGPEGSRNQNGGNGPRAEKQPKQQADAWAQNKAKGALFGAALGDALGLRTDGLHPSEVAERNPRG